MPCEDFSKLCPACLKRASKCSEPIAREYIPVNSLRLPRSTTPLTMTAEVSTQFDTKLGGQVIGKALCKDLEPYIKTHRDNVRRFHMWIRQTTPAERGPNTRGSCKVIVTVLLDVDTARLAGASEFLDDLEDDFPTRFKDAARGFELDVGSWEMKLMGQDEHESVFRLNWFMALNSPQEHDDCGPYMMWSNFPPLEYGETKRVEIIEDPWFIWREKHPDQTNGIPAGAAGSC
ncbi:hypothetical protein BJY00DRAFT_310726 [Aspergillus carlsbadensis]|nr:hypothetical protein BJY00DRAFT_310726 [Aspergillus carlsbadensis]